MSYKIEEDIHLLTGKLYGKGSELAVYDVLVKDKTILAELHTYITDVNVLAAILAYLEKGG